MIIEKAFIKKYKDNLRKNVKLSNYSWFNLGGNAEYFYKARDKNQLLEEKSSLDNQLGLLNKDESKPTETTKEKISNDTSTEESSKTTESSEAESNETEEKKEEN